jgi:hypothetical protein
MQSFPDKRTIMEGLAHFLSSDLKGHVSDPALAFRVLVAANLARIAASELGTEDEQGLRTWHRLASMLHVKVPEALPSTTADRTAAFSALEDELVRRLRGREFKGPQLAAVRSHLLAALRDELSVCNPRFSTAMHIEPAVGRDAT